MTTETPKPGNDTGLPALNLLEAALLIQEGDLRGADYVRTVKRALPLDKLRDLPADQVEALAGLVCWLNDYVILLNEYCEMKAHGAGTAYLGHPVLPGPTGPFIDTCLTRGGDVPDFSPIWTYGLPKGDAQ